MKHFVYLDTDLINSYLSQINNELVNSSKIKEHSSRTQINSLDKMPITDKSNLSIGLTGFLKYQHDFNGEYIKEISTILQTEAG